ncbi:MAG: nuclear transport factor 2 family protein [Proteobacteria bacterium]|nr:nuclear transport factor 2 family protein [Pseudomonadota bacterium]
MKFILAFVILALLPASPLLAGAPTPTEKEVWSLEDAYWRYVQANDMDRYRTLWAKDFLGWPLSSPEPLRKDHITDWIAQHTRAGESLKSYSLERLASQETEGCVTLAYRVKLTWISRDGTDTPGSLRVIHTWRHIGGQWQIISGMAAAPNAQGH